MGAITHSFEHFTRHKRSKTPVRYVTTLLATLRSSILTNQIAAFGRAMNKVGCRRKRLIALKFPLILQRSVSL